MRLRRLDLMRYGRFTDRALDLPPPVAGGIDIQILFGPNEAGKSTALSALEDLLFGIPARSPLNFLHDYPAMRLGAVLEADGERLELRRRKGNRDTLLTAEEVPLPGGEAALAPFLGGADRAFFERMFSLDHGRLRSGGREILEAQGEVGRMLFAAGAGLGGLRERLAALERDADALWGPRKAARRAYAQAEDKLKAAEQALREQTVTASRWQELRRDRDAADAAYAEAEAQIQERAAERSRLARIRRVHGDIRRMTELDSTIAGLEGVPDLPADAGARLDAALRAAERAEARLEPARTQLAELQAVHDALQPDAALLARRDDIRQLDERRSEVRPERGSLPKRRQELAAAEAKLQRLAEALDWPALSPADLLARIPARPKLEALTAQLTRRGAVAAALEAAGTALKEAQAKREEAARALADVPEAADTGRLAAELRARQEAGDPAPRIEAEARRLAEAEAALRQGLDGLRPALPDIAALAALAVPPRATVQDWRDAGRALAQRRRACADQRQAAEAERDRHRTAADRIRRGGHAVGPEELQAARDGRDRGWQELRRRLNAAEMPAEDALDGHEAAVQAADALADRRFETAEAAGQLAATQRQLAEQEDLLAGLQRRAEALAAETDRMAADWRALWSGLPEAPGTADAMLDWLDARDGLLRREAERAAAALELAALRAAEAEGRSALLVAMSDLGPEEAARAAPLRDRPLAVVQQAAAACLQRHERLAEAQARAADALRIAEAEVAHRRAALADAERDWAQWRDAWRDRAASAGLSGEEGAEEAAAKVNALAEMQAIAGPAEALRLDRIEKIERDIAAFEAEAAALAAAVAPDLAEQDGDPLVLELERRLEAAERTEAERAGKAREIATASQGLATLEAEGRTAQEAVAELQRMAGVADEAALKAAIAQAERLQAARGERDSLLQRLAEAGDGLDPAALAAECAGADIDEVMAREGALEAELAELNDRLLDLRDARRDARAAFDAVGGTDAAARAAADRQAALAEMQEVAERYVRARSAALLLDWAIDRYRQEKQAPLLAQASRHFAMLTGGSFSELALEFGDGDALQLTGRRPDGARVGIDGMSDGTADQLYLALRVAAVEDYLDRAPALPFVADDLFVHFDDDRAEAGFRVLGALARRTQVLVFTHHRHLVDVARAALGPDLPCLSLADGAAI